MCKNWFLKIIMCISLKMHDSFIIPFTPSPRLTTTSNFFLLIKIIFTHNVTPLCLCAFDSSSLLFESSAMKAFLVFFAVSWVYLHFSCSKGNERKCFMCYLRKADCISLIHPYSGLPIEIFSYLGSLNAAFLIQSHAMNRKGAKIVFWKEPKFYYKRAF